jgi:fibronectin type 3 domain-containing protein
MRAGWSQVHAFPRTVTDLAPTNIGVSSFTLQWTSPGYDGHDGALQIGSTYFIRVASYTVPDTFSDHRFANISFSTSGVVPGEVVSIGLLGLLPATTYYARIWTTDGDSDISYASNISSGVLRPTPLGPPQPATGTLAAVYISSLTAFWADSFGANSYLLIASTVTSYVPASASSATAATTATLTGLNANTTYFVGVTACDPICSPFTSLGSTVTLAAPALSLSTANVSSTTISLAWNPNGNPSITRFAVRGSTDNVTFLSLKTVTTSNTVLNGLVHATTYYLKIVALNDAGTEADPSNQLAIRTLDGPIPFPPSGVSASAVLLGVSLRWDELPPDGVGTGLFFFRVSRSTNAGFGFATSTTTSNNAYVDRPLTLGVTYYYRITTRDVTQVESSFTATVGAFPFTIAPMEPIGVKVVPAPASVALSWSRTTQHGDGNVFLSTTTPLPDELIGYGIYRSSDICSPSYVNISSLPYNVTNLVDNTGGLNYFYRIHSYNSIGLSTNAVTLSSLGERNYFLDDCVSRVVLDNATAAGLNADVNGLGDIRIDRRRVTEDVHDGVFQSGIFRPMLGATELKNYPLPKPVRIVLHFETANGVPVPDAAPAAAPAASGVTVKNLGLFWYNGAEFKKVYGVVDPITQTVTVESPNLGKYQVRALARANGPVFDVSNISGRAITPNGDGLNDVVIFTYDPGPNNETVSGSIYDVMGSHVADMTAGQVPNTLVWNGTANGRTVGGGAYIYRIRGGGKTYTGTIVVAR